MGGPKIKGNIMSVVQRFSRMSVRAKLSLLVTVAAMGLILLGGGGTFALWQQRQNADQALTQQASLLRAVVGIENANVFFKLQSQEFKNVLIRGNNKADFDKYLASFDDAGRKLRGEMDKAQAELKSLGLATAEIPPLLNELDALNRELHAALAAFDVNDPLSGQKVDKAVPGRFRKPTTEMNALVDKTEKAATQAVQQAVAQLGSDYATKRNLFVAIFITLATLLAGMATLVVRSILRQLGGEPAYAAEVSRRIAEGDLSTAISLQKGDQTSLLAAMKTMQDQLQRIVADIRQLVAAASQGNFKNRIDTRDKHGFGLEIGESLNQLIQTTDHGLSDITRVSQALAEGDLSLSIEEHYAGQFGDTMSAMNNTVRVLNQVVADVRRMVDGAAQGDFSQTVVSDGHRGYARTLADLLNSLNATANGALSDIAEVAHAMAEGDLSRKIEHRFPGLFGETAEGINKTIQSLHDLVAEIRMAVETINTAAGEISQGNADLSRRTEEQASSLEETAASMEQLNSTVKQNAFNAGQAHDQVQHSAQVARRGGELVNSVVATMNMIQESAHRMSDIVGMIDGIAFQTNILALNAAVEAARAGEHGRGFAVVATEVRALSQRSAAAAKEIKNLIDTSVAKVSEGNQQVSDAGATMGEVVHDFQAVVNLVSKISSASREQSTGVEQIAKAVTQMDEVTQQNAALVEQAAAAADSLHHQAGTLVRTVGRFKGV